MDHLVESIGEDGGRRALTASIRSFFEGTDLLLAELINFLRSSPRFVRIDSSHHCTCPKTQQIISHAVLNTKE